MDFGSRCLMDVPFNQQHRDSTPAPFDPAPDPWSQLVVDVPLNEQREATPPPPKRVPDPWSYFPDVPLNEQHRYNTPPPLDPALADFKSEAPPHLIEAREAYFQEFCPIRAQPPPMSDADYLALFEIEEPHVPLPGMHAINGASPSLISSPARSQRQSRDARSCSSDRFSDSDSEDDSGSDSDGYYTYHQPDLLVVYDPREKLYRFQEQRTPSPVRSQENSHRRYEEASRLPPSGSQGNPIVLYKELVPALPAGSQENPILLYEESGTSSPQTQPERSSKQVTAVDTVHVSTRNSSQIPENISGELSSSASTSSTAGASAPRPKSKVGKSPAPRTPTRRTARFAPYTSSPLKKMLYRAPTQNSVE